MGVNQICVDRVASICDEALQALPEGRHREQVAAVRAHFYGPLRVAIAGRIKAGKSTLVNALVGAPIAPTAVEECTKVVTWYSHGVPERVARQASARWHAYHNVSAVSEVEMRIARIMYRSYDAIVHQAGGGVPA